LHTWIVSREDLILSKLVWALDSGSELQRRDIGQLLAQDFDRDYAHLWARRHAMSDTSAAAAKTVAYRHRQMTATERWLAASSLFETARAIVESSLPGNLTLAQRRLAVARRLYGTELPEAALIAHANYVSSARAS
jgi:hypothetical protein